MMKILIKIGIGLLIIVMGFIGYIALNSRSLTKVEALENIQELLMKEVKKNSTVTTALVYYDSKKNGVSESFVAGDAIGKDQPFHIASVGKVFTATLIGKLIDNGDLALSDTIDNYLEKDIIEGLFVYEGIDYSEIVSIEQLLSHTSGVADYFDDEVTSGDKLIEIVKNEPNRFFTPKDLLDFSRYKQVTKGKPGEDYHYSDTGYILLGLVIESITHNSFDKMLHDEIFLPLNMDDSYLMFYSEPLNEKKPLSSVWLGDSDIRTFNSLSIDWSGGGIVSTLDDLAVFIRALNNNEIISEETLNSLYKFDFKYMRGLHYGNGFMSYHFNEYFPTLNFLPNFIGHMGVLGTQLVYDKHTDTVYISSFGSTDYAAGSVQTMIKILSYIERIK